MRLQEGSTHSAELVLKLLRLYEGLAEGTVLGAILIQLIDSLFLNFVPRNGPH